MVWAPDTQHVVTDITDSISLLFLLTFFFFFTHKVSVSAEDGWVSKEALSVAAAVIPESLPKKVLLAVRFSQPTRCAHN